MGVANTAGTTRSAPSMASTPSIAKLITEVLHSTPGSFCASTSLLLTIISASCTNASRFQCAQAPQLPSDVLLGQETGHHECAKKTAACSKGSLEFVAGLFGRTVFLHNRSWGVPILKESKGSVPSLFFEQPCTTSLDLGTLKWGPLLHCSWIKLLVFLLLFIFRFGESGAANKQSVFCMPKGCP